MWKTIIIIVLAIVWVVFWGAATAHYIDGPLERPYHFSPKVALGFVLGALLGPFGPLVTIIFLMDKDAYSPFATWGTFYGESLSAGMAALNPLNHFSEWERAQRAAGYRERYKMDEKAKIILMAVIGAVVAGGIPALLDWLFTAFWPTWVSLLVLSVIGCFVSYATLVPQYSKPPIAYRVVPVVVWIVVFGLFAFVFWRRHSLSPVWFGIVWGLAFGITMKIESLKHLEWKKEHGISKPCPSCGAELKYKSEGYAGSTQTIGSGGTGTRTAQYESIYECPKCGYEGPPR